MSARRLARWVVRAAVIGALAVGGVYAATVASADEAPAQNEPGTVVQNGVIWN